MKKRRPCYHEGSLSFRLHIEVPNGNCSVEYSAFPRTVQRSDHNQIQTLWVIPGQALNETRRGGAVRRDVERFQDSDQLGRADVAAGLDDDFQLLQLVGELGVHTSA